MILLKALGFIGLGVVILIAIVFFYEVYECILDKCFPEDKDQKWDFY